MATRVAESQRRLQLTANTIIATLLTADEKEKKKTLCSGLHSLKIRENASASIRQAIATKKAAPLLTLMRNGVLMGL